MITTRERPDQSSRIFRIALVLSLVAHLVAGFLVYESNADLRRVLARLNVRPTPEPKDEIVTLSSALKIEKRAEPQPQPHPVRVAERPPARPAPKTEPHPAARPVAVVVPQRVAVKQPVPPAPSRAQHELAKLAPHAAPEPPKTTTAKLETTTPTAPPATPKAEVVASLEHRPAVTEPKPPARPEPDSRPAHFSQAQLAHIQHDLAKTIVQARVENNPLSNVSKPVTVAAATHRYAIDFSALAGDMRQAQGLCDPIKSWQADGWDYYYATCTIQEPDGSTSRKPMPWPVRWRPRNDPWNGSYRIASGPMPLPPPGWRPDRPVDPDFIPYLRKNGFAI